MQSLSKYDVMNKKSYKFSEILKSFTKKYALSFTQKKKRESIKILLDKILLNAHVIFEIKKDIINYLRTNNRDMNAFNFLEELELISKELEKILLIYLLIDEIDHEKIIDLFLQKASESEIYLYLYRMLSEEEQEILKFVMSKDYNFNLLPSYYKSLILDRHSEFIDMNINIYVNTYEPKEIDILKGIKLYKEKVDMNISSEIKKYQSVKQKIKD